jgi:transposase
MLCERIFCFYIVINLLYTILYRNIYKMALSNASESSEDILSSSEWPPSPTPAPRIRTSPLPPPATTRRHWQQTTRDQRLQIQALHTAGLKQQEIEHQLRISRNQVRYAIKHPATPSKKRGRHSQLSNEEIERIIEWVCASAANRRCPWERIPLKVGLDTSYYTVRYALRKAGFSRRLARRKPPISEQNRQIRLDFALEH